MRTIALRSCPGCSRHVRVSEPACPFCGRKLDDAFRSVPGTCAPTTRLSRAALFALGAGGLVASSACSSSSGSSTGTAYPAYGGAACTDAGCGYFSAEASVEFYADGAPDAITSDAVTDGGVGDIQSAQGDAAADAEAGANSDAGADCGNLGSLYGACPVE
jgi:hypothetical protein